MSVGPKVRFRSVVLIVAGAMLCGFPRIAFPQADDIDWPTQEVLVSRSAAANPMPNFSEGLIKLDVVATDNQGKAWKGLRAENFTLLDNGEPQKLVTFRAEEGLSGPEDPVNPLAQVVLVFDAINLDPLQIMAAENAVQNFLRQDHGRLAHPVSIYRLSAKGLVVSLRPSLDGEALAAKIGDESAFRPLMSGAALGPSQSSSAPSWLNTFSLIALGKIVLDQRRIAGRKVLIWIGPGWPADCTGCNKSHDWMTELSTRMREARIALYGVSAWGSFHSYAGPSPRDANPTNMALAVLALNSGGRVLGASSGADELIRQCADEADTYYTLTFDPPRTGTVDDYHELKVVAKGNNAEMRSWTGYYNEPSFYDQGNTSNESVTIQQLEQILADAPGHSEAKLTEALSRVISVPAPGTERSVQAVPDVAAQREMMSRTLTYLGEIIPHLPDFFATRTTTRYRPLPKKQSWKSADPNSTIRFSSSSVEVIRYHDGAEIADPISTKRNAKHMGQRDPEESLDTAGTFGPILYTVIKDAAASSLSWSHWEKRPVGRNAIFRFVVPKDKSHYSVSFCCLTDMNNSGVLNWVTGYHGEFAIDPESGAILRLTVQADLEPRLPILRADITVTYNEVDIGEKLYICPTHSVALSRKRTVTEIHEWLDTSKTMSPFITVLNDTTFTNYHKFGSESRMLPGYTAAPNEP